MSILKNIRPKHGLIGVVAIAALGCAPTDGEDNGSTQGQAMENEQQAQESQQQSKALNVRLSGAGASFPAPLYQTWFDELQGKYSGLQISYQSVGSGAGIRQYIAGTVDFGASDAPLTEEEKQRFREKYGAEPIQVPTTGGLLVFAHNLPGVEDLRLSRDAYCGIVSGDIQQWDAQAIQEANPNQDLPSENIDWIHRSDGSGTTFLFTNHLSEACGNWNAGAAKTVDWPVGVGAKGNEGVASTIQQTEGAIGYVAYAYAKENNIPTATIENKAGNFVEPSPSAAAKAFEGADIPEDFGLLVPDPSGEQAYPIAGLTFLLLYPEYDDQQVAEATEQMIDWALKNGDQYAADLNYIPLPQSVQQRVMETVEQEVEGTTQASS